METRANYVIIGAFTFGVAVVAVLFGLFTARYTTDRAWDRYEIVFDESVMGLSNGSAVLYNGVNVGRVTDIGLYPGDARQVQVIVDIESDVPIHTDTVATLRLTGLTGTAAIQLTGGTPGSPMLEAPGRQLPRIPSNASPLARLLESSEGIVVTANSVLNQLGQLLEADNIERVEQTLAALETFSTGLNRPDHPLNRALAGAAATGEDLPALIERLNEAAARFTETVDAIDRGLVRDLPEVSERLTGTLARIESLAGRLDRIVAANQDDLSRLGGVGMRQVGGGLDDLRQLIRQLSGLIRELEQDPSGFLLGGERPEEYSTP
ncbi:MCE family protein [Wenzhouxiangella sp. XN79A]|uniref:MlaD family protein n=1 Tax=Wenzhouxiangella sp. XN79A TaxID=2724193 RepID=UPI00144AA42E|nr:MlaD family protein [Wenzhouxiangella sp. XN79A]NKI33698.1 MCE family protein [Wenzhouxiangella sp. XN79A]